MPKATLTLSEKEIHEAIRDWVEKSGWKAGSVTISHDPGDYREPSSTSAKVEVSLMPSMIDTDGYAQDACDSCGETIQRVAGTWSHIGPIQPRHPAVPKSDFNKKNR